MDADSYVRSNEMRLASAEVDQITPTPPATGTGELICTDSRLVFDTAKSLTDIRVDSISEIDYSPASYLNSLTVGGLLIIPVTLAAWFLLSALLPDLPLPLVVVPVLGLLFGSLLLIVGILRSGATLVIKTNCSEYRFQGSEAELSRVPHAIRGADRS